MAGVQEHPFWPIAPSTDIRVVSVVLRVNVLRSTHNCQSQWHCLHSSLFSTDSEHRLTSRLRVGPGPESLGASSPWQEPGPGPWASKLPVPDFRSISSFIKVCAGARLWPPCDAHCATYQRRSLGARPSCHGTTLKLAACSTSLWSSSSATFVVQVGSESAVSSRNSSVARFKGRYFGGSKSCLVALMVLDFGRVINLT